MKPHLVYNYQPKVDTELLKVQVEKSEVGVEHPQLGRERKNEREKERERKREGERERERKRERDSE
jgi:hypothetical protein